MFRTMVHLYLDRVKPGCLYYIKKLFTFSVPRQGSRDSQVLYLHHQRLCLFSSSFLLDNHYHKIQTPVARISPLDSPTSQRLDSAIQGWTRRHVRSGAFGIDRERRIVLISWFTARGVDPSYYLCPPRWIHRLGAPSLSLENESWSTYLKRSSACSLFS